MVETNQETNARACVLAFTSSCKQTHISRIEMFEQSGDFQQNLIRASASAISWRFFLKTGARYDKLSESLSPLTNNEEATTTKKLRPKNIFLYHAVYAVGTALTIVASSHYS